MVMPWSKDIDDIMLQTLLWEQHKRRIVYKHGIPVHVDIVKKSYTELYELVKQKRKSSEKKRGLSHETFRDHLNRLVEKLQMLRKYPKGKRQVYGFDLEMYLNIVTNTLNLSPEELDRRRLKIEYGLT